jgi:hypothetical protein
MLVTSGHDASLTVFLGMMQMFLTTFSKGEAFSVVAAAVHTIAWAGLK